MIQPETQSAPIYSGYSTTDDAIQEHPALADAHYHELHKIGSGAQGTMYRALNAENQPVAIKIFNLQTAEGLKDIELIEREMKLLKNLHIDGIPRFIESLHSNTQIYLVEEYIDAPSLKSLIDQNRRFTTEQIIKILKNMAKILRECGESVPPVVHRDIKPANILIDDEMNPHLVDFGVAASLVHKTIASTYAGTPGYIAPEQVYGKTSPTSDIFSLGVTMLHLITGIDPVEMDIKNMTLDFDKHMPSNIPGWIRELLHRMVAPNPDDRIQNGTELERCIETGERERPLPAAKSFSPIADSSAINLDVLLAQQLPNLLVVNEYFKPRLTLCYRRYVYLVINLCFFFPWVIYSIIEGGVRDFGASILLNLLMMITSVLFEVVFYVMFIFAKKKYKLTPSIITINQLAQRAILEQTETHTTDRKFNTFVNQCRDELRMPSQATEEALAPLSYEENERLEQYLKEPNDLHPCVLYPPSNSTSSWKLNHGVINTALIIIMGIGNLICAYMGMLVPRYARFSIISVLLFIVLIAIIIYANKAHACKLPIDIFRLYSRRFMQETKEKLNSK